jgi:hypothetical protein
MAINCKKVLNPLGIGRWPPVFLFFTRCHKYLQLMLMQKSGSYYEDYRRMRGAPTGEPGDTKRLLTDRSAYISYLEVQLERVSTACLTSQGFRLVLHAVASGWNIID